MFTIKRHAHRTDVLHNGKIYKKFYGFWSHRDAVDYLAMYNRFK